METTTFDLRAAARAVLASLNSNGPTAASAAVDVWKALLGTDDTSIAIDRAYMYAASQSPVAVHLAPF